MDKKLFQGTKKEKAVPLVDIRYAIKKVIDCIKGYKKYKKIDKLKAFILTTDTFDPKKYKTIKAIHKEIDRYNEINCVVNLNKMKRAELNAYAIKKGIDIGENIRGTAPRKTGGNAFKPLQELTGIKKYANKTEQKQIEDDLTNVKDPFNVDIKLTDEYGALTNETTKLGLRNNQTEFIEKMVYSNNRGAIAFWGVGTGKTILTVLTIRNYLHYYPQGKVVFVAPSALLSNLIKTLYLFGLDIRDNRIHYYSFERYARIKESCYNGLLIIDEAHNMRTQIKTEATGKTIMIKNDKGVEEPRPEIKAKKGGRPLAIIEYCSSSASKVLLLTATPLVNTPFDINNLLAMIDGRDPLKSNTFFEIITNKEQAEDFLSYRISHFIRKFDDEDYPERRENILFGKMSEQETADFNSIQNLAKGEEKKFKEGEEEDNYSQSFYSGQRQFINKVGQHKKIKMVVDHLNPNNQNVIYISFIQKGVIPIVNELEKKKIKYSIVSGEQGSVEKQKAVEDYNSGAISTIIISKAGAEGLDLKKTTNLYVLDQPWNEAMREQIIGRGIRFKSHKDLPSEKRFVNVYNVFLIKYGTEEEIFVKKVEKITQSKDFSLILNLLKEKEALAKIKQAEEAGASFSKTEKQRNQAVIWVSEEDKAEAKKMGVSMVKYYEDISFNKYASERQRATKFDPPINLSIDPYLYIYSKSKQYVINEFIKFLDTLPPFEKGLSPLEKKILDELQKRNPSNREEKLEIYKEVLKTNINEAGKIITERNSMIEANVNKLKLEDLKNEKKLEKLRNSVLQQYFTGDNEIDLLYKLSGIKEDPRKTGIQFLEPTAGTGSIIKYFIEREADRIEIKCCEFDPETRTHLKKVTETLGLGEETLYNEPNFLKLNPSDRFDYIIMNPPFNIKPYKNLGYKKPIYDIDFIKHAYMCCKVGGRIVAIMYGEHAKEGLKDRLGENYSWLKEHAKPHFRDSKTGNMDNKFFRQTINWLGATDKKMAKEAGQKIKGLKIVTVIIDKKDNTEDKMLFDEMRDLVEWDEGEDPTWSEVANVEIVDIPKTDVDIPKTDTELSKRYDKNFNFDNVFSTYVKMRQSFVPREQSYNKDGTLNSSIIKFPPFMCDDWVSEYAYNYILEKNSNDCTFNIAGIFNYRNKTNEQESDIKTSRIILGRQKEGKFKEIHILVYAKDIKKKKLNDDFDNMNMDKTEIMAYYKDILTKYGIPLERGYQRGYDPYFILQKGFDKTYEKWLECDKVGDILCIMLTIGDYGGHSNMLVINGATMAFERYEPHGARTGGRELNMSSYLDSEEYDTIIKYMMKYWNKKYNTNFSYQEPSKTCPRPPKGETEKVKKKGQFFSKKEMLEKFKGGRFDKKHFDKKASTDRTDYYDKDDNNVGYTLKGMKGKYTLFQKYAETELVEKNVGFQTLEGNEVQQGLKQVYNNIVFKEVGGYCCMWSFFLMDLRLKNPKIPANELFSMAYKELNNADKPFRSFIRGFSSEILADMESNFNGSLESLIMSNEAIAVSKVGKKGGLTAITKAEIKKWEDTHVKELRIKINNFLTEKKVRAEERLKKRGKSMVF